MLTKAVLQLLVKECSDVSTFNNYDLFYIFAKFMSLCVSLVFENAGVTQVTVLVNISLIRMGSGVPARISGLLLWGLDLGGVKNFSHKSLQRSKIDYSC